MYIYCIINNNLIKGTVKFSRFLFYNCLFIAIQKDTHGRVPKNNQKNAFFLLFFIIFQIK